MAVTLRVVCDDHYSFSVEAWGLQHPANSYDKFIVKIYQNDQCIIKTTFYPHEDNDTYVIECLFEAYDGYYGWNWLSPGCSYEAYVDCYLGGNCFPVGPTPFGTPRISFNSSVTSIRPSVYVPVRDQGRYQTCVAESLACAMDIFRAKNQGVIYERFSSAYIYGGEGAVNNDTTEGQFTPKAIDFCYNSGSPRYEIFSGFLPDGMYKSEAINLYQNHDIRVQSHAAKQRFASKSYYSNVDFYDCQAILECLQAGNIFIFTFEIPKNFEKIGSDGIVPQPDKRRSDEMGHAMAIIGLTTINGIPHWIAQNSWGETWGDGGRCYIPYDWGCGVQAPVKNSDSPTSWTSDSYVVSAGSGYSEDGPSAVYNVRATQVGNEQKVLLQWNTNETNATYTILARQSNTTRWWYKTITSNTSATVDVDESTDYDFMVITIKNAHCSAQSSIAKVTVESFIITDLSVERGDASLTFTWSGANAATGYNITLTNNEDGTTYKPASLSVEDKMCVFENLSYGVAHTISIQPYSSTEIAESTVATVTTAPAALQVSLRQRMHEETNDVGLRWECSTDVVTYCSEIYFEIWDITETEMYWNSSITINELGTIQKSDTDYSDNYTHGNTYKIKIQTMVYSSDSELDGVYDIYGPMAEAFVTIITEKPSLWEWTSPMTGQLEVDAYNEVHPVTADEWNQFVDRIRDTGRYMWFILKILSSAEDCDHVISKQDLTGKIYNDAVYGISNHIQALKRKYTDITISVPDSIYLDTILSASLFIELKDALNSVINALD